VKEFPVQLVEYLANMMKSGLRPRDIVQPDSIRNAVIVAMAVGGSTNAVLHTPEIARAAGYEHFWRDIMTPDEFNRLSRDIVPVLTNARPYGTYSMIDIDRVGGVQVIVRELLEAGLLNGDMMTCTGRTLAEQVADLETPAPDNEVIFPVKSPYKPTGGLRMLGGNLSPDYSAILKLAGVEGGLEDNLFRGRAQVFEGEADLLKALDETPDRFRDNDMIIVRYAGPTGAPGMPEMLDPTSRITTLCRERKIVIALMTDARFSGGSVGLVIGHVGPEAAMGGNIALVEDDDEIVVDLNTNEINCTVLDDAATKATRRAAWEKAVADNGGVHPNCGDANTRLLHRARHAAVSALRGGGLHPNHDVWVRDPRTPVDTGFVTRNKHRE
jgi:dihydroxy-acid dehydratase